MKLNFIWNIVSSVYKVCFTNYTKDKFLYITTSGLRKADNSNFASCIENKQQALEHTELPYIHEFIGEILEQYIWTDTGMSIHDSI